MVTDLVPWNLTVTAALIFPLIIFFFFFFFFFVFKKFESVDVTLPPGPKKLPIIGNLHLISEPPFHSFRDLAQKYGPIIQLKLGEVDTVVISSTEILKEMLKDNDHIFTEKPESIALKIFWYNYVNVAFSPYGDYWRQMRKICIVELLSNKSVRSLGSVRDDEVSILVGSLRLSSGKTVNLTEKIYAFMSSVTCRAAFGKVCKDKDALIKLVKEGLDMGAGTLIADLFPSSKIAKALSWGTKLKLMRMRRKMDVILDDIIREHEKNREEMDADSGNGDFGDEDLVDVFLRVKESGDMKFPIGYDNIKAVLFDMFAGGTETTTSTVDWAMTEVVRNPRVMAKVQAEIREMVKEKRSKIEEEDIQKLKYLKVVIMETLRLHPPVSIFPRVSKEACQVSGYTIGKNTRVLVNIWAIQRDPKYWKDGERFVPERFENDNEAALINYTGSDFQYLPFGSGRRMCPGMAFGSASVALPLAHLLHHFNWELPPGLDAHDLEMTETSGLATNRKQNLFLVATPYPIIINKPHLPST